MQHRPQSRKSVIFSLPVTLLNSYLSQYGLRKTWYAIMKTHLEEKARVDLAYLLEKPQFLHAPILSYDFLKSLSVGEISVLYEYSLAYLDGDRRKQAGQYFTPDDVALVMVERANLFPKGKVWLDPCSGVGNLSYWLAHSQSNPEHFLLSNLILVDRDALALEIARFVFTINFQKNIHDFYDRLAKNFIVTDFLEAQQLPRYDFALLNPPYVQTMSDRRFETSQARDLYAYFLEKVIKTTQGFVSITPQTFTNGQKFLSLRRLLVRSFNQLSIYCFDNVPDNIFRGIKFGSKNTNTANSTRAGIIVARQDDSCEPSLRITPLLRWQTKDRRRLLKSLDRFLTQVPVQWQIFPKLQMSLVSLYLLVGSSHSPLSSLLTNERTEFQLLVPSTPRYFISALKKSVKRTSMKRLYFHNAHDRDLAYLLLNSSYMYWWWRVNDGGMSLSERTLLSLPIIRFSKLDERLLAKIEQSEMTNRVVKKNAGKLNENVKHDRILIAELNEAILPQYAHDLLSLHNNSVLL